MRPGFELQRDSASGLLALALQVELLQRDWRGLKTQELRLCPHQPQCLYSVRTILKLEWSFLEAYLQLHRQRDQAQAKKKSWLASRRRRGLGWAGSRRWPEAVRLQISRSWVAKLHRFAPFVQRATSQSEYLCRPVCSERQTNRVQEGRQQV
jgi:hypothetical protein